MIVSWLAANTRANVRLDIPSSRARSSGVSSGSPDLSAMSLAGAEVDRCTPCSRRGEVVTVRLVEQLRQQLHRMTREERGGRGRQLPGELESGSQMLRP